MIPMLLLTAVSLAACTSNEQLTRDSVRPIIDRYLNSDADKLQVQTSRQGAALGVELGLWEFRGQALGGTTTLTEKGKRYFKSASRMWPSGTVLVDLTERPQRMVAEITGIADSPLGPGIKEVQFTWVYLSGQPWLMANSGSGATAGSDGFPLAKALLRRFDDGWRVEGTENTKHTEYELLVDRLPKVK